jgi:hypothetical protein
MSSRFGSDEFETLCEIADLRRKLRDAQEELARLRAIHQAGSRPELSAAKALQWGSEMKMARPAQSQ